MSCCGEFSEKHGHGMEGDQHLSKDKRFKEEKEKESYWYVQEFKKEEDKGFHGKVPVLFQVQFQVQVSLIVPVTKYQPVSITIQVSVYWGSRAAWSDWKCFCYA